MAKVPYSPLPQVEPSTAGTPGFAPSVVADAFGANVAESLGRLGKAVEGAGDEVFKRALALQTMENDAVAKEADARYMIEAGKLHADYNSTLGKAAVDGYPRYVENLKTLRTNIRETLPNPAVQKLYDGPSLSVMGRTVFNGAGHAATENKKWQLGASAAKVDAWREYTLQNPTDNAAVEEGLRGTANEIRSIQAPIAGWSDEKTEMEVKNGVSGLTASRIIGLSRTQPATALELFNASGNLLSAADRDRTEKIVQGAMRTTGARVLSNKVNQEGVDSGPSLEERVATARAEAEKLSPDDTIFQDTVRDRVIADYSRLRTIRRDDEWRNKNVIEGALMGGVGGALPTNIDELVQLSPDVRIAWDKLDEKTQRGYLKQMVTNAKADVPLTTERMRNWQRLRGMAQSDTIEFLNVDVTQEDIPRPQKQELIRLQQTMKAKSEGDPRVRRAMSMLLPMLGPADLGRRTEANKDRFDSFVGALQDALTDHAGETKKVPTAEEINKIGARLLQQQSTPGFIFGNTWPNKKATFEVPVPSADAEIIRNRPEWKSIGVQPTDEMVQRVYTRELYRKFYGGAVKRDQPTGPKVPDSR